MLDSIVYPAFIHPYIIGISPEFFAAKNQRNTPLADSPFSFRIFKVCSVLSAKSFSSAGLHNLFRTFLSKIRSLVIISRHARVAKLVDAPDLGSGGSSMGVRVPSRAPISTLSLLDISRDFLYFQFHIYRTFLKFIRESNC